jgi:copper chaperone NosL
VSRAPLAGAVILLAVTLTLPLWSTRMEAPQYKGEEALVVDVYAGRVHGDIGEIELLNQYVGVQLPLDTPELAAAVWVLGAFLAVALVALALPITMRRRTALALTIVMVMVLLGGGALLQYRLYQMGHERGDTIMEGVPDFTPPVLGSKHIANFTVHMSLGVGAWTYLGAILLIARSSRRPPTRDSVTLSEAQEKGSPVGRESHPEKSSLFTGTRQQGVTHVG